MPTLLDNSTMAPLRERFSNLTDSLPANPEGRSLVVMVSVLMILSIASTFVRVVIRLMTRLAGWDDVAIALGLVFLIIQSCCEIIAGSLRLGLHVGQLPPESLSSALRWVLISQLFLMLSLCFTKCSICIFVLRIYNNSRLKWALWGLIVMFVVTEIPVFLFWFLVCTPISSFWTGHLERCHGAWIYNDLVWLQIGECTTTAFGIALTSIAFSIVGDIACALLPIVTLYEVQVKARLKYALCGLVAFGLIATGCSIGRAVTTAYIDPADITYSTIPIQFWASAEANLAVIGANIALSRMVYTFFRNGPKRSVVRAYMDIEKTPSEPSRPRGRKLVRTREEQEKAHAEQEKTPAL